MAARPRWRTGISLARMGALVGAGQASPLLPAAASPVLYEGAWWAVPLDVGVDDYQPVINAEAVETLTDLAIRLRRGEEVAHAERRS